ncbi:MAG: response regulator [Bacteroidales bacterium]|nr:response regulator [Bacteroidales bacterium]
MVNLLIASSQVLHIQAIEHLIREYNEKVVVEHAESGEHILALSHDTYFDLIIIDLNLEGLSGLDLLRKMNARSLNSKVLIVSVPPDEFLLKEMIDLDVKGFLSHSADGDEYILAVNSMIHSKPSATGILQQPFLMISSIRQ